MTFFVESKDGLQFRNSEKKSEDEKSVTVYSPSLQQEVTIPKNVLLGNGLLSEKFSEIIIRDDEISYYTNAHEAVIEANYEVESISLSSGYSRSEEKIQISSFALANDHSGTTTPSQSYRATVYLARY